MLYFAYSTNEWFELIFAKYGKYLRNRWEKSISTHLLAEQNFSFLPMMVSPFDIDGIAVGDLVKIHRGQYSPGTARVKILHPKWVTLKRGRQTFCIPQTSLLPADYIPIRNDLEVHDPVVFVKGKYEGEAGEVTKVHKKMVSVQLDEVFEMPGHDPEPPVRVPQTSVQLGFASSDSSNPETEASTDTNC